MWKALRRFSSIPEIKLTNSLTIDKIAKAFSKPVDDVLNDFKFMLQNVNLKHNHTVPSSAAETYIFGMHGFPVHPVKGLPPLRPPIVTIMGHVDHGKTTLLDSFRNSNVCASEFGGITQGIGAFSMTVMPKQTSTKQQITFLDTPGHEAFSNMRSRGAQVTDMVVLVVSAVEGVQQQTIEAITHATDAGVPIIAAINKIDVIGASPKKVEMQLKAQGLKLDMHGGDILHVNISAKKKTNLDKLEEAMLFQAELMELRADPTCLAQGIVIESRVKHGKGSVCTVLVNRGTLKIGDIYVIGQFTGRVRAMLDDNGKSLKAVGPSGAVELTGMKEVPEAGDLLMVVPTQERAREIASFRGLMLERKVAQSFELKPVAELPKLYMPLRNRAEKREFISAFKSGKLNSAVDILQSEVETKKSSTELKQQILATNEQETQGVRLILKAENRGMLEAVEQSVTELIEAEEQDIQIIRSSIGEVCEDDVDCAIEFKAKIITMNVGIKGDLKAKAERENIQIKMHRIIYHLLDDIILMAKELEVVHDDVVISGTAVVRKVYELDAKTKAKPIVAGLEVTSGVLRTRCLFKVMRKGELVEKDLELDTLKRFKANVKEVTKGQECGISFLNYKNFQEDDVIQAYELKRPEKH